MFGATPPSPLASEGEIVRCAWHGWEFEIATGRCHVDPQLRAKTYPVEISDGSVYVIV